MSIRRGAREHGRARADGGMDADDEVFDLAVAPAGSHVLVWLSDGDLPVKGQVARTDEAGSAMLVTLEDRTERWVTSEQRWTLAELQPENEEAPPPAPARGELPLLADDTPIIRSFEWNADGTLSGRVYGKPGFRDGEAITTSAVDPAQRHATYVITESGSAYMLGEARQPDRQQADVRRSGRATVKESLLDAFTERGEQPVANMAGMTWLVGGAEVGGAAAEKVMRSAFTVLDDNLVNLRAQYAQARRFVLCREGVPVAAAVAEAHANHATLEVPILAAAKTQRQKGHGSLLVALLIEVAAQLRLETLVVSSTPEAMSFWVRQGMHTLAASSPQVRAAVRALQSGRGSNGFANSVTMARLLPSRHAPVVQEAVERVRRADAPRTMSSSEAPAVLGYEDVNSLGNFSLQPDGSRRPVHYRAHEQLRVNVPYSKLQAFDTRIVDASGASTTRGWGVRCAAPISEGQVVVEVRGRALSEIEYEGLEDKAYVVSFDDKLLRLKREAGDDVLYLDLKQQGNMMRLINDSQEAPNLQLMYWPELDLARRVHGGG